LNSGKGNITLWINSPGGDVFAAAQIYNMLMDYPYDVTVKIDALAASAASVIAMAGTKVCMSPVAMLMVHNPGDHRDRRQRGDAESHRHAERSQGKHHERLRNQVRPLKSQDLKAHGRRDLDEREGKPRSSDLQMRSSSRMAPSLPREDDKETEGGPEIEMLFSRKAVTDSLLSKLIPKRTPMQKDMKPAIKAD
jgi:ATP-dependent Clp protease protease subunit